MWEKKGNIYSGYAQTPIALNIGNSIYRIYFSERIKNVSFISSIDIDIFNPYNIINKKEKILMPGNKGLFDHYGVMPSSVVRIDEKNIFLYYTGWSRKNDVPYHNAIGLAISTDNGDSFQKYAEGPIISTSIEDPYFVGTPYVTIINNLWRCWYYSCVGWKELNEKLEPRYYIKHAESLNGINWSIKNIAINFKNDNEGGICQPSVIFDNNLYKMWFSYRGINNYRKIKENSYRIGYAESLDSFIWERLDNKSGINISLKGWDSEMVCYPNVIIHENKKYLFYNGNNFGKTGIGIAVQ